MGKGTRVGAEAAVVIAIRAYRMGRMLTLARLDIDGEIEIERVDGTDRDMEFLRGLTCRARDKSLYTISDGARWLRELERNLRGGYFWAEEAGTPPSPRPAASQPTLS